MWLLQQNHTSPVTTQGCLSSPPRLWVRVTLDTDGGGGGRDAPPPMKKWIRIGKQRHADGPPLIQEHLQYADVFFCTLCLLNCLWLRASVMKLYVLVERAASPFQLGPGRSLLSGFCKTFFPLIHVLMNKWSPWSHFFHICVNCFKSILSCHKKAQLICWA